MFDVIVLGAGVAGASCALGFAREGRSVLILDKKPDDDSYKTLCTHFVQPLALPVLEKLGLRPALSELGLATKAAFWTSAGWIDPPDDYALTPGSDELVAFNIERRLLDPLLMQRLRAESAVEVRLAASVEAVQRAQAGDYEVVYRVHGAQLSARAKLVVAADGRSSSVARLLGNTLQANAENQRVCSFAYFEGVPAPAHNRSLFYLGDQRMAFLYPLPRGRALLSAYLPKALSGELERRDGGAALLGIFSNFPDGPSLREARLASPHFGYSDYPNRWRSPVHAGVAFIGDAALSLDPMSGVGCAFALHSADLLVRALSPALAGADAAAREPALASYAAAFREFFSPHAKGIVADSIVAKSPATIANVYGRIARSSELQRKFIALTARLLSPAAFQKAFLVADAKRRDPTAHTPKAGSLP